MIELKAIAKDAKEKILTGVIKILPPMLGDPRPPKDAEVSRVSSGEVFFTALDTAESSQQSIDYALKGVEGIRTYLAETGLKHPEIEFLKTFQNSNLLRPILPSFEFDNKVFVRPVAKVGTKYRVEGIASFGSSPIENPKFSFDYYQEVSAKSRRGYACENNELFVKRYPIILPDNPNNRVSKLASLGLEVLCNQLEPITSSRLAYNLLQGAPNDMGKQDYLTNMAGRFVYEERLMACALVKAWLLSSSENFETSEILNWAPFGIDTGLPIETLRKIQANPGNIVQAYSAKAWSLTSFLQGLFE